MLNLVSGDFILYFWNAECSVCEPLYDTLVALVSTEFLNIELKKINIVDHPELRTRFAVYSSPVILLLLDGKEYLRRSGNVRIHELQQKIERLYTLKFDK